MPAFSREAALQTAIASFANHLDGLRKSLARWVKISKTEQGSSMETPAAYEARVLGWPAEKTMANGNPLKHKKFRADVDADADADADAP